MAQDDGSRLAEALQHLQAAHALVMELERVSWQVDGFRWRLGQTAGVRIGRGDMRRLLRGLNHDLRRIRIGVNNSMILAMAKIQQHCYEQQQAPDDEPAQPEFNEAELGF